MPSRVMVTVTAVLAGTLKLPFKNVFSTPVVGGREEIQHSELNEREARDVRPSKQKKAGNDSCSANDSLTRKCKRFVTDR